VLELVGQELPVVLRYLSGQRFFVRGLTAGIGK
jgi:hypothetical protein